MADTTTFAGKMARSRLLVRGESLVGFVGIAAAAIVLGMIALAGWWSMRGQQQAWRFVREQQVRVLTQVLSQSAESMLAANELSALRRLLVDSKQHHDLRECRIMLSDGRVLADADPANITLVALPEQWPSGPVDAESTDAVASIDQLTVNQPLLIRGKGAATLKIVAPITASSAQIWETAGGIGMIGAAGLAAMLIVYRRMRSKVMTLGLIRDSLLAAPDKNASRAALMLRPEMGPEAQAWNLLLEENETLRKSSLAERVKGSMGTRRESRGDLEHACDALAVGMIVIDEQGSVKHANGAAAVLLQFKRDQVIGQDITQLIGDAEAADTIRAIISGSGQRRTIELHRPEDRGGGILRIHVRPMRREDSGGALVTIEDVTQQRVADAARNTFVAQATHELRTPLTNMRLCLESALDDQDSDPKVIREHFNTLNHETRRLERMVGEMLSVAQIEAGSLRLHQDDIRLDKIFEELQADYRQQATEKKITLTFELPPKLPVIQGDRDKLMVALHNLLGNALKYTPSEGKATVSVRTEASQLMVDVADTGIGISPEEQPKVFEKFYRAKDQRVEKITGTGLGLTLAREIARLHGGDIVLHSELNQGSTFTLVLPVVAQAKAA